MLSDRTKPEPRTPTGPFIETEFEVVVQPGMSPFRIRNETVIICDTTQNDITVKLLDINAIRGQYKDIFNIGTGTVTITPFGTNTILGETTITINQDSSIRIYAPKHNVNDWKIIGGYGDWGLV